MKSKTQQFIKTKLTTYVFMLLVVIFGFTVIHQGKTHADVASLTTETGCSVLQSYTGQLDLKAGMYDAYARLARSGDRAQIQGYKQELGHQGECTSLGSIAATGDKWTKMGTFSALEDGTYVLQLSSAALASLPDANRPSLMLVPHNSPICMPDVECAVKVQGQAGYVRPTGTLLNRDSLHVLQVVDPAKDTIKSVNYYLDDRLLYTSSKLTPFDLRYVSNQNQNAVAIVTYASGQRVIVPQKLPFDAGYEYNNPIIIIFRMYKLSPILPRLLLAASGVLLVLWLIFLLIDRYHRKRLWSDEHGVTQYIEDHMSDAQKSFIHIRQKIVKIIKPIFMTSITLIVVAALIFSINTYIADLFTIDGQSMESTYHDKHMVLINKMPATWAHINHLEYQPKRGDVVIVHAVFGDTTTALGDTVNLYLIKRVIGLPGDHIVIKDGHVTIYNVAHPNGFDPDQGSPWQKTMHPNLQTEQLDITLSQSQIFVSGDNRPESIDSRFNGPLHTRDVVGLVVANLW